MNNYVQSEETPRTHYAMLPNLVDDLDLDVYEFRLYCHLRRVAGENGACWQSTQTLAEACQMSAGKVSAAKQGLLEAGLVAISESRGPGGVSHTVTILDIWLRNAEHAAKRSRGERITESVHVVNANAESVHVVNAERSRGETKKNPIKKNHIEEEPGEAQSAAPDFLPDQFALSIKAIQDQKFTRAQWQPILEAEQARGDAARTTLVSFIEKKLSANQHPAVQVYRDETHYYPPAEWGARIVEQVGTNGSLDLWREVVAGYVGCGWNPRNVKAMLEHFARGEVPSTGKPTTTQPAPGPGTRAEEAFRATAFERAQKLMGGGK